MGTTTSQTGVHQFGVYEVDTRARELRKQGLRVRIQDQPFQVLVMLLERPGETVSREDLRKRLWPDDTFVDFDHSLSTAINKIREALGDSAESPRFIETVPRHGYRFIALPPPPPPAPPLRYTPSGIVREVLPNVVAAAIESHQGKSRWRLAALGIALLALAAIALLLVRLKVFG
jgi:DNA-binding winged helix-turn-helix (wHTH) protein